MSLFEVISILFGFGSLLIALIELVLKLIQLNNKK